MRYSDGATRNAPRVVAFRSCFATASELLRLALLGRCAVRAFTRGHETWRGAALLHRRISPIAFVDIARCIRDFNLRDECQLDARQGTFKACSPVPESIPGAARWSGEADVFARSLSDRDSLC